MADNELQRVVLDSEEKFALWNQGREAWNAYVAAHPDKFLELIEKVEVEPVLSGAAAMALWLQGSGNWNQWVAANPNAEVDFSDQQFEVNKRRFRRPPSIDFSHFEFPDGRVNFNNAKFGEGMVAFTLAKFGKGNISFIGTKFSSGQVLFPYTKFGDGDLYFRYTKFGNCNVNFEDAIFGDGEVSFYCAKFGKGEVSFKRAAFGTGKINFQCAEFSESNLNFEDASLGKGEFDFSNASFGCGSVGLRNLTFEGIARFDKLRKLEQCVEFSFEGCSFDKLFTFSHEGRMGCPLDLRRTKLTHGVVLNDVKCDYVEVPVLAWPARLCHWFFAYPDGEPPAWQLLKRAADQEDSQRFRRLKELAQNENNRAKALEFNAQELRSQRGHESHPLQDFLQFFYMLLSDYGRSVVRPLVGLVVVTLLFGALYARLATNPALTAAKAAWAAFTYSASNMFAFVPISRDALEKSRMDLFGNLVPYDVMWLAGSQSVLSAILLFLLGLGLRNMFRL